MSSRSSRNLKNLEGFTLLETLIATALMGIILAALATITSQWLPNWNRGFARVQRYEQIALGLERLVDDLSAAEFIPANREIQQPLFDGTAHSVAFVRTTDVPGAGPSLEMVRIAQTVSAQGSMVVRTRAPFVPMPGNIGDQNQLKFGDPVVLLRAPYELSFSYAAADRIWRDAWRQEDQLPKAIKLTLRDASQGTFVISTATRMRAEIPVGCIVAKSLENCLVSLRPPSRSAEATKTPEVSASQTR
jgi:general secretion pathway protein J